MEKTKEKQVELWEVNFQEVRIWRPWSETNLGAVAQDHQSTNDENQHELKQRIRKHHIIVPFNTVYRQFELVTRKQEDNLSAVWCKVECKCCVAAHVHV